MTRIDFSKLLLATYFSLPLVLAEQSPQTFLRRFISGARTTQTVNTFQVLETIPHDTDAFTQGLTFDPQRSDVVYESTGLYGESDVRIVDIETGEVRKLQPTPTSVFGEGLAFYTNSANEKRLIHITWREQRGFIFDADTLTVVEEFSYTTSNNQGWGITYNPNTNQFIVTDGSEYLHFWDANNLQEVARIPVFKRASTWVEATNSFFSFLFGMKQEVQDTRVSRLNEIEWDNQSQTVLANVWQTDLIVRIDPTTGLVTTEYDLSDLYKWRDPGADVLNGIAISPEKDLWVTGKKWPKMYRICFNECEKSDLNVTGTSC